MAERDLLTVLVAAIGESTTVEPRFTGRREAQR